MSIIINENLSTINLNHNRTQKIEYIVIHFTSNNGDTAWANTNYFKDVYRGASAHLFVDENSIWRSVKDSDTAWHCGTTGEYKHPYCRNSNSIGIEMCSRKDDIGIYYIKDEVINNTIDIVKELMKTYNIPVGNVLRHYDVTGKICPEPFIRQLSLWPSFKEQLKADQGIVNTPVYKVSEENLAAMVGLGIIVSPEYWKNVTTVEYLDTLLSNAAKTRMCHKEIYNGIKEVDKALDILVDAGIISTREYWERVIDIKTQYIDKLLINISNKCRVVLEKIVHAEAHEEGLEGQVHVADVIRNRCNDKTFPDGIYNVVFQESIKDGNLTYQFKSIGNGAYTRAIPSESVKQAIDIMLESDDSSMGATYFCSVKEAELPTNWHEKVLQFLFEYKNLRFYKAK